MGFLTSQGGSCRVAIEHVWFNRSDLGSIAIPDWEVLASGSERSVLSRHLTSCMKPVNRCPSAAARCANMLHMQHQSGLLLFHRQQAAGRRFVDWLVKG